MAPKYGFDPRSNICWEIGRGTDIQLAKIIAGHLMLKILPRVTHKKKLWACTCRWALGGHVAIGMGTDNTVVAIGAVAFNINNRIAPAGLPVYISVEHAGITPSLSLRARCQSLVCHATTIDHVALNLVTKNFFILQQKELIFCAPCTETSWVCCGCGQHFKSLHDLAKHQGDLPEGKYMPRFQSLIKDERPAGVYTPTLHEIRSKGVCLRNHGLSQQTMGQLWSRLLGLGGAL